MLNCHGLFRAEEIWFLKDNEKFKNRRLEIGTCPFCNNKIIGLFEREKGTNKLFFYRARDKKALKLFKELKSQIDYKKSDISKGTRANMGFVFGKNEIHYINGKNFIIQKSVDFNGSERVIKKYIYQDTTQI